MMARRGSRLLPIAELETMRGWEKLEPQEQSTIRAEFKEIAASLRSEGQSRLAIGKRLVNVQSILAPKRLFERFLRKYFHMSRSTAFNYMNLWKAASRNASTKVLNIAMSRNFRVINKPEIFKAYPPPKTDDTRKILQYLNNLERSKPRVVSVHKSADNLLKDALHVVDRCLRQLPDEGRSRSKWVHTLIGMELTKFGIKEETAFFPVKIPEEFFIPRGRPRLKKAA